MAHKTNTKAAKRKVKTRGAFGYNGLDNRFSMTRYKKYAKKNMTYREWYWSGGSEIK